MEYFDVNLRDTYSKPSKFPMSVQILQSYARELLKSLYFIKKLGMIHADIKPDNILLTKEAKRIKLCDFGSAMYLSEAGITEYVQSRYYRAPEIILGCQFDYQIDMWSLGCTLFEAYTSGKILFPGVSNYDMLRLMLKLKSSKFPKWMTKDGQFSKKHFDENGQLIGCKVDPGLLRPGIDDLMVAIKAVNSKIEPMTLVLLKDFLQKCLTIDPKERMCVEDALGHPFIGLKSKPRLYSDNSGVKK